MYKYLSRNGVLAGSLLALLALIIAVIPILGGVDAFEALPDDPKIRSIAPEGDIFYTGIYVTFALLVLAVIAVIVLGIFGIFKDFKSSKNGVIGFAVILIFFGIFYATASTDVSGSFAEAISNPEFEVFDADGKLNVPVYKLISGTITGTVILLGIAFLSMFVMEIWNFFKTA